MVGLGILETIIQTRLLPTETPPCKNCAEKSNKVLHDLTEQLSPEVEGAWKKLEAGEIHSKEFVKVLREHYDNDKIEELVNKLLNATEPNCPECDKKEFVQLLKEKYDNVELEGLVNKLLDKGEKLRLYTSELCEHCKTAKEYLSDMIKSGEVETVNVDNNQVLHTFIDDNFGGVPAVTVEFEGRICEINIKDGTISKCINKK